MTRKKKVKTFRERWDEAQQKLYAIRQRMYCTHPGFKRVVIVMHGDGSTMIYHSAFAVVVGEEPVIPDGMTYPYPEEFEDQRLLAVFTEHNGYHLFSIADLHQWDELQPVEGPLAKDLDEVAEQAERLREEYAARHKRNRKSRKAP